MVWLLVNSITMRSIPIQTGGRRQAVLEGGHVVFVVEHRFVIARRFGVHLIRKRCARSSASFSSLKPLPISRPPMKNSKRSVISGLTSLRRASENFRRVFGDEGRLNQMRFRHFVKDFGNYASQPQLFST